MRNQYFWTLSIALSLVFGVQADSSHAIMRLLNSRAAGNPVDFEKAACEVRADAENGKPLQQYVIALIADYKDVPESAKLDPDTRKKYFDNSRDRIIQLAEKKNNPLAWYLLSLERNDLDLLQRAADGGNVQALNSWGTFKLTQALKNYDSETNDVEAVICSSYACFKNAAAQGDANGHYNCGMCLMNGYGCERNLNLAYEHFRIAAKAGHSEAINNIGGFYRDGIIVRPNLAEAAKYFRQSSEAGNAFGQLNYALALQRGEGVDKDEAGAFELLKTSAEHDCIEAMDFLGLCYLQGVGTTQDYPKAVFWFKNSAKGGYPAAMEHLADCFDRGNGVSRNVETAMIWKIRARAHSGDGNAAAWLKQNGHSLR